MIKLGDIVNYKKGLISLGVSDDGFVICIRGNKRWYLRHNNLDVVSINAQTYV